MSVHQLSCADARRIAVTAQLLDATPVPGLLELVRGLTLLQNDPVNTIAPSAHVVAWSRLGSAYAMQEMTDAIAGRALIELHGLIRPAEDIALYRAQMERWPGATTGWRAGQARWVEANDTLRRDVLHLLERDGPMTSREIPDTATVPWKSTGWNDDRNVMMMLEMMASRGEIAVSGQRDRDRLWDLAERVYPDDPVVPYEDAVHQRDELRLHSLGIARAKTTQTQVEANHVGQAGEPAVVEGTKGQWRVDPEWLEHPLTPRTALLSPIDRLVYDRKRMEELFEFDYQLEMFKPKAKRRWGYWALPILHGDRLVGKVDATADRKAGVLRVDAIHEDLPFSAHLRDEVREQLEDLALWLDLEPALPR